VLLKKDGEDQLDRLCEKWGSITQSSRKNGISYITKRKRKNADWIHHILRSNCLLKHVTEAKIGGIELKERQGRRRRQLLDDLKEKRILKTER
jgi:hypothetical protein